MESQTLMICLGNNGIWKNIYIVTNATQKYNVRLWKPNVHISAIGLYLAGKPGDGINLAGHSLPIQGLDG